VRIALGCLFVYPIHNRIMLKPKAQSWSIQGSKHQTNDDTATINLEAGIYVICDGVSEGGEGRFAADLVSRSLEESLTLARKQIDQRAPTTKPSRLIQMQDAMIQAFHEAQANLQKAALQNPKYRLSATTCIALWLDGRFGIMAHIGDSRAYLFRGKKIYQLTKDHSGLDELIAMGLPPEVAAKNPLAKGLTRAFGNARYNHPDLLKIEFQGDDLLILCTDGVYSAYPPGQFDVPGFVKVLQMDQTTGQDRNVRGFLDRTADISGDDSTLVALSIPKDPLVSPSVQASDRIKFVSQTPLSKYFDYVQKSHIAAICDLEAIQAGSVLMQEGTDGEKMYIVCSGTLEVQMQGQHVAYKKAGDFLGEVALIQQIKRTATLVAKEDTVLLSLKRQDLFEVFKKDVAIEKAFYRSMLEMILEQMVKQGQEIAQMKGL